MYPTGVPMLMVRFENSFDLSILTTSAILYCPTDLETPQLTDSGLHSKSVHSEKHCNSVATQGGNVLEFVVHD